MARMSRKELRQDEIAEAAADAGHWLEEHWQSTLKWVAAALAIILVIVAGVWWVRSSRKALTAEIAATQAAYIEASEGGFADADALSSALDSFSTLSAKNRGSAPGRLAGYYQALTLHQLGRNDEAITVLEQLVEGNASNPSSTMASAHMLLVNLFLGQGRADDAIAVLERVRESSTPAIPADQTLHRLALILEDQGEIERAQELWRTIRDEYSESSSANEARQKLTNS